MKLLLNGLAILRSIASGLPVTNPPSSKQKGRTSFYRYYAGYPLEFATWALDEMAAGVDDLVLDPWNGSGTTTAACAATGRRSIGCDINPVMLTVARARVGSSVAYDRALEAVSKSALESVRGTIRELAGTFRRVCAKGGLHVESDEASILLTAMFPIARRVSGVTKSKNPSWFRAAEGSTAAENHVWSGEEVAQNIRTISGKRPGLLIDQVVPRIVQHDSRRRLKNVRDVDAILTSPPYVTRIDYVRATLPELMLLEHLGIVDSINKLRRTMLGTPLTTARSQRDLTALPPKVRSILHRIANHDSKASGTYYHRFFSAYFFDLQTSLSNVCRALKPGGRLCMVVQGLPLQRDSN